MVRHISSCSESLLKSQRNADRRDLIGYILAIHKIDKPSSLEYLRPSFMLRDDHTEYHPQPEGDEPPILGSPQSTPRQVT